MADNPLAAWLLQQDRPPGASAEEGRAAAPGPTAATGPAAATAVAGAPPAGAPDGQSPSVWDLEPGPATRSPRRLILMAVIPWIVVVVLVATLWRPAAGTSAPPSGEPAAARGPAAADPGAADDAEEIAEPSRATSATATATAGEDAMLRHIAALTVKAELHGAVEADGEAGPDMRVRYADEAVGTDIERLGDVAVVTVIALVLEGGERGWDRSLTTRHAVALRSVPSGVEPLGAPWALPPSGTPPEHEPVPDESPDRVLTALEAAGYRQISDLRLSRPAGVGGVLVAAARAVGPGEDAPTEQQVWIRDGPEPSVLGHRP